MCSYNNMPMMPYNIADCCCPIILKNIMEKVSAENEQIMPAGCMMPGTMMPGCMMPAMMMPIMPGCMMPAMMPSAKPNVSPEYMTPPMMSNTKPSMTPGCMMPTMMEEEEDMKPMEDMMNRCMMTEGMSPHIKMKTVSLEDIQK